MKTENVIFEEEAFVMVNLIGICIAAAIWSSAYIQNDIAPEVINTSQEYVEKMEQRKIHRGLYINI